MATKEDEMLKLVALDEEDLKIVSAHLQDAVMQVGDLTYLANEKRFVLACNRFVWEKTFLKRRKAKERRRTALHFERVTKVQAKNIRRNAKDAVVNLLAIQFEQGDTPSGTVELIFSGDGIIRLEVECIEAQLSDLGGAWSTGSEPTHE